MGKHVSREAIPAKSKKSICVTSEASERAREIERIAQQQVEGLRRRLAFVVQDLFTVQFELKRFRETIASRVILDENNRK